jgi:nucleoid-associated protein YgaU
MGTHYIGLLMKFKPEREIKFVEDLPEFVYVPPPISESVKIEYQSAVSYYRDQVTKGIPLSTQIGLVKSIISKYEPQGIDVTELKTELKTLEEKLQKQTSEEARTRASELTQEGIKEYQNGNYMNSLKNLSEASALVPEDKTISNLKRKLESLAVVVVEIPGTDKTSEMLRKGINAYLEDDIPKSMNILRYLYEKNPKNITISKVLKLIEIEHPEIPLRDNYNPSVGLINMKLDRALQHIYNEEYTAAIAECNEILELEPNNVMALIRLGSAYYSLKNISKATEYWSKALALDPNNIELNEFIRDAKLNIKPGMVPKKTTVESKTKKYIVQKGDTLPKIAEKVYGDKTKWRKIFDANKNILDNPYSLSVGQELTIP